MNSEENLSENLYLTYSNNQLTDPSLISFTTYKNTLNINNNNNSLLANANNANSDLNNNNNNNKFNNAAKQALIGSPIDFNVAIDLSQVLVEFQKCKSLLINQMSSFYVESKDTNNIQGDVKVVMTSPSNTHLQLKAINNQNGTWKVDFKPSEIGEYFIDVFYANQLIPGSPFKSNVFDPSKIKIVPTFYGTVDQAVKFEVDASQAGFGQLEIAVENGRIPCTFLNQGNLRFVPSFTPREAGKHEVTIKFNSYEVPGSPFICNVVDINKIILANYDSRNPIIFPIGKISSVELNSNDLSSSNINIKLMSPSGVQVPINRAVTPHNTLKLSFQPSEIGTHRLEIDYAGFTIPGSPFEVKIYDSTRIIVSDIKCLDSNKLCELIIDASNAGEGQLEIGINDGQIKNNVKQIKPGQYSVTFAPPKPDNYVVDVKFNKETVLGCPKKINLKENNSSQSQIKISSAIIDNVIVNSLQSFQLESIQDINYLEIRIRAPSGHEMTPKIYKTGNENCRVEWTPHELGTYLVNVNYCCTPVKGTPFRIKTYDPKRVQVLNIADGMLPKPNTFLVDASQAGEGSLEIGINCNGHFIPNQVKPLGNSKFEVHFLPQEAAIHYANINFNSEPVRGSPFPIRIQQSSTDLTSNNSSILTAAHLQYNNQIQQLNNSHLYPGNYNNLKNQSSLGLIPINMPATFQILSSSKGNSGQIRVTATGPKGENLPVKLLQQSNGDCLGEFLPTSVGQYRIDIFYMNQPVSGSPQIATAFDPMAIEITHMPKELVAGVENYIEINMSRVGNLDLDIKMTSPTGMSIPLTFETIGHRKIIRIITNEIGMHRVIMLLAGHPISCTPFAINSVDVRMPIAKGDGLQFGIEDKQAVFYVDAQSMLGNLDVKIEGPHHFTKNQIERQVDGVYVVKYTPVEVGLFKIFIKWNNREIPGSPFRSYVVNPDKVRVFGGWQSILDYSNVLNLKLFEERIITFDVSDAGPGSMEANIVAPNGTKLPLRLTNQIQNQYQLSFTALYEGEYKIYLLWNNHPIPNSPIIAKTINQSDINRIEVTGAGLHEAKINQEAEFIIDGSRAGELYGLPEVKLTGVRCDIDIRLMQLGHNNYRCTYIPQIPGAYLLNIKWNERQIGDSPYKVSVGMNSDPSKVIVSSEGIKTGLLGQDIKTIIDTRRAGPGELTAHCMGPQKVAFCEFYDHKDGTFTLFVKPQEHGKHILQIKYNDEHVPGSPFLIKISGPPDASKVLVIGPGICHGVLSRFKSRFICETKGAGAGQLTVRIRGPKGAFRVEMQRENQKDRTILCKYDPVESGDYQVNVKWSGQHVPGSPFNVHIFSHEDELEQFLRLNPEDAYVFQQQQQQQQQLAINC